MFATINTLAPRVAQAQRDEAVTILNSAFQERPDLRDGLISQLNQGGVGADFALYTSLASYVQELRQQRSMPTREIAEAPAAKKRKLDGEKLVNGASRDDRSGSSLTGSWSGNLFEAVSFTVPQRKKLSLEISTKPKEGVRAINPSTKETEFGVTWDVAEHVVCLPVPEKAQAARNFVVFPKNGDGLSDASEATQEPIVWTAADTLPRGAEEGAKTQAAIMMETLKAGGIKVQEPTEAEFASELPQPHRKNEKAYHVKAFRGSKDGFLFFLPTGIVWGFKKPLIFFSFATIDSISYTSVLQRTFNLSIAARPTSSNAEPVEYEFSMIDQVDFAGIDSYIKKHNLQDASMAEDRRAKKLNINGVRGQKQEEGHDGEEEESELRKAEREVEMRADDEEDEEDDENFDPGSEGESEGSGTSDEESGDEGGDGQDVGDDDDDDEDEE